MLRTLVLSSARHTDDINKIISALPFGERERERLALIKSNSHKAESACALYALKLLLSLGNIPPRNILRTESGKPYFDGINAPAFSLSHSHGICAAAITDKKSIGLDIELIDKSCDIQKLAKRFFGSNELKLFESQGQSHDAFFKLWTRKEAYTKADGRGLCALLGQSIPEDSLFYTQIHELEGLHFALSLYPCEKASDTEIYIGEETT